MTKLLTPPTRLVVNKAAASVVAQPKTKKVIPPISGVRKENSLNGREIEEEFARILAGQSIFKVVTNYPSMEFMRRLAADFHAAKLTTLLESFGGSYTALDAMGPKAFLDLLFKVDFLLEYKDDKGERVRVAIDITGCSESVIGKETELIGKRTTLYKLGVDQVCVVLWNRKPGQQPYLEKPPEQVIWDRLVNYKQYFCNTVLIY